MQGTSFLSTNELANIGLKQFGKEVLISRNAQIYSPATISLGSNVRIDDFTILSGGTGISIGSFVHIACHSVIFGAGKVFIDDFANISSRVAIYSESDDYTGKTLTNPTIPRMYKSAQHIAPVHCSRHSIIYTGSTILPGVTLGEGTVLGAHSLARDNLTEWSIYAGTPARYLGPRSKKLLEQESHFLANTPPSATR